MLKRSSTLRWRRTYTNPALRPDPRFLTFHRTGSIQLTRMRSRAGSPPWTYRSAPGSATTERTHGHPVVCTTVGWPRRFGACPNVELEVTVRIDGAGLVADGRLTVILPRNRDVILVGQGIQCPKLYRRAYFDDDADLLQRASQRSVSSTGTPSRCPPTAPGYIRAVGDARPGSGIGKTLARIVCASTYSRSAGSWFRRT